MPEETVGRDQYFTRFLDFLRCFLAGVVERIFGGGELSREICRVN